MKCECGEEMHEAGFNKDTDTAYHICRNKECPHYKDVRGVSY